MRDYAKNGLLVFVVWVLFSSVASGIKVDADACGKSYPVDYVLFTNAFCAVKP